jgi:hypothetical protein
MPRESASAVEHELRQFELGVHDHTQLDHAEHVRVAYEMVTRYPFDEALHRYSVGLRRLTARVGLTGKFHTTITVAFLSLVAERHAVTKAECWSDFVRVAPDLFDRQCLERWYPRSVLASGLAQATFVLPRSQELRDDSC